MDMFGIGTALRAAANLYFTMARRSGRTTLLVENVKDGDRIVCVNQQHMREVERLVKERKVDVECIVISPEDPKQLFERGTSQGRTIFDHAWIERYYQVSLDRAAENIDRFERETSGYGAAHRETARQASEFRAHHIGNPAAAMVDYLLSPRKK